MRILFSIIIGLSFLGLGWSQQNLSTSYEVQYEASFSMDTTQLDKKSSETLYLYTGKDTGVFMNYSTAHWDEIKADLEHQLKTTGQINITKNFSSDFPKTFYKNLSSGKVKTKDKLDRKQYIFDEPETPVQWNIEDETKEIQGYMAQKATTHFAGRDYEAWFTLEIPISDGPYIFSGLPGLIIALNDTENQYQFTLKSIEKLPETKIFQLPDAEQIAKSDFVKLREEVEKNNLHNTFQAGNIQFKVINSPNMSQQDKMDNKKMLKQMKENKAHKNNPIERK